MMPRKRIEDSGSKALTILSLSTLPSRSSRPYFREEEGNCWLSSRQS